MERNSDNLALFKLRKKKFFLKFGEILEDSGEKVIQALSDFFIGMKRQKLIQFIVFTRFMKLRNVPRDVLYFFQKNTTIYCNRILTQD